MSKYKFGFEYGFSRTECATIKSASASLRWFIPKFHKRRGQDCYDIELIGVSVPGMTHTQLQKKSREKKLWHKLMQRYRSQHWPFTNVNAGTAWWDDDAGPRPKSDASPSPDPDRERFGGE